ncbi:MAG: sulfate ABC transporter substrate-binding protein [Steroidobacteraceae bacterium]
MFKKASVVYTALAAASLLGSAHAADTFLNVSYDPTREMYAEVNKAFAKHWQARTGEKIRFQASHGGSGGQARAVIDGLQADVVTLALEPDINAIGRNGKLIEAGWQKEFDNNSTPYTSTIVFLVRKGNPKKIQDWNDLARAGVKVVTPNPKTSGGARWNFLAAWGYALKQPGATPETARKLVHAIYKNVPVLDSGARGSTTTFVQRGIGDAAISWENEALLALREFGTDKFEIVAPSISILAEPPVAIVDKVVDRRGTRTIATAYLNYLYSAEGQEIAAKNYYRPTLASVATKYAAQFPKVQLFKLTELFGDWDKAQATFFADNGIFDQIYLK